MGPVTNGAEALLRFFKALGDQSRLSLVGLLARREHNVQELAALLKLREPTVSHHLGVLKEVGLVRMRAEGNTHWYSLDHDELHRINRSVFQPASLAALAQTRLPAADDSSDEKVLRNYLAGERLSKIPDSFKKRLVVLRWLAQKFSPGATYSEAEVNRIIKRHHDDAATLRRELIGCKMLARSAGVYRALPEAQWKAL